MKESTITGTVIRRTRWRSLRRAFHETIRRAQRPPSGVKAFHLHQNYNNNNNNNSTDRDNCSSSINVFVIYVPRRPGATTFTKQRKENTYCCCQTNLCPSSPPSSPSFRSETQVQEHRPYTLTIY